MPFNGFLYQRNAKFPGRADIVAADGQGQDGDQVRQSHEYLVRQGGALYLQADLQGLDGAEAEGGDQGRHGVPAGEDDDGQADEAAARGDGLRKGAHGAKGQGRSGDASQEAAEHIGRQAEAVDLNAGGLGRLGILPPRR